MHMHMQMHTHASTCTCHAHACREKRILEGCPYRVSVCNFKAQRLEEPRTRAVGAHSCGLILYFTTYRLLHSTRPHSTRYSLKLTRAARGASPTDEASLVRTLKRCSRLARARGPGPTRTSKWGRTRLCKGRGRRPQAGLGHALSARTGETHRHRRAAPSSAPSTLPSRRSGWPEGCGAAGYNDGAAAPCQGRRAHRLVDLRCARV